MLCAVSRRVHVVGQMWAAHMRPCTRPCAGCVTDVVVIMRDVLGLDDSLWVGHARSINVLWVLTGVAGIAAAGLCC